MGENEKWKVERLGSGKLEVVVAGGDGVVDVVVGVFKIGFVDFVGDGVDVAVFVFLFGGGFFNSGGGGFRGAFTGFNIVFVVDGVVVVDSVVVAVVVVGGGGSSGFMSIGGFVVDGSDGDGGGVLINEAGSIDVVKIDDAAVLCMSGNVSVVVVAVAVAVVVVVVFVVVVVAACNAGIVVEGTNEED